VRVNSPAGRGFGSKKNKKPKEVKQSAFSNANFQAIGVLSEGPCEGVVGWAQGVFVDGTPLQNSDGSFNFSNVDLQGRPGTAFQTRIQGYGDEVATERSVVTEVKQNLPAITKTITNKSLDGISVSLGVLLEEYPENGGVLGLEVEFQIWIKEGAAGAFVLRHQEVISGRYASLTAFDRYFPVNNANGTISQFQVRVIRLTPQDSDSDRYRRTLQWISLTELVEARLSYKYSQIIAIQLNAEQFDSIPEFSFNNAGRLVEIPNTGVVALDRGVDYAGIWGGLFWEPPLACSDPAWILYDLLTSRRYGMGRILDWKSIDRYSFYEVSRFCNELVPDGKGGLERRFSCNVVIDSKQDAWRVIDSLRSIFRGFAYYQNGAVALAIDKPRSPIMQFTGSDVKDGLFNYVRPPLTDRYSVMLVTWIDPDDDYQRAVETVEIPELVDLYGYRVQEMSAFACTSQGMARRAGLAALLQPETVTFTARRYSVYARPGDLIRIADGRRSEAEAGGLVADVAVTGPNYLLTLDRPVTVTANSLLSITLSNGQIQDRAILSPPGNYTSILVGAYTEAPAVNTNWILITPIVEPQLFTIINAIPLAESDNTEFEIFALEYNPGWRNYIDLGWKVVPRATRQTVPAVINPPLAVTANYTAAAAGNTLSFNWQPPTNPDGTRDPYITGYYFEYKRGVNSEWGDTRSVTTPGIDLDNVLPDFVYVARVASIAIDGKSSNWVETAPIYAGGPNIVAQLDEALRSTALAAI
jgi:predicted phage tail protein